MERLERLRRRLAGTESLRSIAGAMEALAAVRIRGFREAVVALDGYREVLEAGFQVALRDAPEPPGGREDGEEADAPLGVVIFGSDLGLVGQFNVEIATFAAARLERLGGARHAAAVGSRPVPHLEAAGVIPSAVLPVPASPDHVAELAQDLLVLIEGWRAEGVERLAVAHHAYRSGARYGPRWQRLLPLDPEWLEEIAARPWPTRVLPTYRGAWEPLFRFLVREQLYLSLVRAAAESQASEHAGRLAAMERAGRRIDEHLEELRAALRAGRQEAVTGELLDLLTGFRASEEERDGGRYV